MKPSFTVSLLLIIVSCHVNSQSVTTISGARAAGLGYAGSCLKDEFCVFNNIAGLSYVKDPTISTSCDISSLPSANIMAASLALPTSKGAVGLGLFKFGDNLYSEQLLTFGYSHKTGNSSLGISGNVIQYNAEGFGTRHVVSISAGTMTDLAPWLSVGVFINHINQPEIATGEKLPTQISLGFSFAISDQVNAATELYKDLQYPLRWKGGFEYTAFKKTFFRCGYAINPNAYYLGLGFKATRIKIDYALSYSVAPGIGHHISASYQWYSR